MRSPMGSSAASSPLSDVSTDPFEDSKYSKQKGTWTEPPPAKRQRVDDNIANDAAMSRRQEDLFKGDISSDSEGSVPGSPTGSRIDDDDHIYPQVQSCKWEGCGAGDLGNMDKLVEHINQNHIEGKSKSYVCEWESCSRKNMPHASGYALRAHMRSHTREKPFYCLLPECDKCFTRSDALAKHMRIVHETEALRPSDPIPKTMQPNLSKSQSRLKLIVKQPQNGSSTSSPTHSPSTTQNPSLPPPNADGLTPLPPDLFTPAELQLGPDVLYRLIRRELHWAEEESEALRQQCELVEGIRRKEWEEKEILLDQVILNEIDWHERRNMVLASLPAPSQTAKDVEKGDEDLSTKIEDKGGDQAEAAAVLASMSSA